MLLYWAAFASVVLLDTLCVLYVFPHLPGFSTNVGLMQAFMVTFTSAVVIGIALLEIGGGQVFRRFLVTFGCPEKLALQVVRNLYYTFAPLLCACALVIWTKLIPELGFQTIWPQALIAGVILDFIDHGVIVPWFFKMAKPE